MYSAPARLIRGTGPRPSPVAIYGSAPNRQDNGFGRPFVGDAGAVLSLFLRWWGVDRNQLFVSNVVKYWPGEESPEPSSADIRRDAALLEAELEEVRPRLIIALGRVASAHFMGGDVDMDLMHGIPHKGINGLTVIPCYHPAAGLHDLQMAQRTWQDLKVACDYIQAPKREKVWVESVKPVTVRRVRLNAPEIITDPAAIDTEGRPGSPHSIQYSRWPDYSLVVSADDAHWLDFRGPVIFHNAKYDVRMCQEMGVKLPPAKLWEDTMIRAYCRQDLPHGLKALSYRALRRPMASFEDTVRTAFNPLAIDYLEAVAACGGWTRPDYELVEDRTTGRMKVYRPNPTNNRAKSILKTFAKKPDTKINELWFNIPAPQRQEVEDVLGPFPKFGIEIVPQALADEYGGLDAARTLEIHQLLAPEPVPAVYRQDVEVVPALVECEVNGLPFSLERSSQRATEFKEEYEAYREELREIAGDDTFNPASPKQVHAILHGKWRIKSSRRTKLTGDDSWDKKALAILALQWAGREDPLGKKVQRFVFLLQEHRETVKLYGTYVGPEALPTQVKKGRIHAWLKNTMVVSGRLASEDPNLQNIPSRTKRGKLIRSCFVAPKGSVLLEVDYSQIELRVLADVSGDPALIAAFTGAEDLHRKTEKYIFGIPDDRAGEKRVAAKCFHPDTEVLTRSRGWRKITDITTDEVIAQFHPDDKTITWTRPIEVFTMKHPSKKLIHFKSEGIDLRVTPDHRMLSYSRTGSYAVTLAEDFCDRERLIMNAGTVVDDEGGSTRRRLLQLVVATQADGSFTYDQITFGFTRKRKIARMEEILQGLRMPSEWVHRVNNWKAGEVHTFVLRPELTRIVKEYLSSKKTFQWDLLKLSAAEREIVVLELAYWDGHQDRNAFRYFSKVRQNVEVAQALAAITGRKTRRVTNKSGMHILTVRDNDQTYTNKGMKREIKYTGKVACLSVPSTFVLVRDGGVPVVCGQTFNFRIAYAGPAGSPRGLQEQLFLDGITLSVEACAEYRDRWFAMYPKVAAFLRAAGDEARRHGYAQTVGGRRRYLPFARLNEVPRARAEAERQAGNLKIQGYAQEVIKASMTRWDRWGRRKTNAIAPTKLCMQIHDSLVFEVGTTKPKVIADVARIILRMMLKGNEHFKVPILAEAKAGSDWGNLEKIKL